MTVQWLGMGMRIALCAMAHLSDDETVAKMGHPTIVMTFKSGPPAGRRTGNPVPHTNCSIFSWLEGTQGGILGFLQAGDALLHSS